MKILLFVVALFFALPAFTQKDTTISVISSERERATEQLTESQLKQLHRQQRRDSIRAHKKIWTSILGGPSYTPEASLGIGGAMLMSFRMNRFDSISQRSFIPVGFNISLNGTFVAAGAGTLFFNENKFRIYVRYGFRTEPANFFGVGFDEIKKTEDLEDLYGKDSITVFHKTTVQFNPKFVWEVYPKIYAGALLDINYSKSTEMEPYMASNPAIVKFGPKYRNIGLGALLQYDSRDDVATPFTGMLLSGTGMLFGKYLGGNNNYEMIELEYRQFQRMFKRRSTLGWIVKSQIGMDNVPYTELPSFGSPFDLRGYIWGKYRDKSMAYGIVEYRHMFMSEEAYKRGAFWSKFGVVGWVGTGTLGKTPADWDEWKINYGIGFRVQLQPRKNFRLDIGKEPGQKWAVYMNMTEAF